MQSLDPDILKVFMSIYMTAVVNLMLPGTVEQAVARLRINWSNDLIMLLPQTLAPHNLIML